MRRTKDPTRVEKRRRRIRPFLVLCWLTSALVGLFVFGAKLEACSVAPQTAAAAPGDSRQPKRKPTLDAARADAGAADPGEADAGNASAGGLPIPLDPDAGFLDYAVIQTPEDFPEGLSPEEKNALGDGKVPIHREGEFRSPLAHPRFGGPTLAAVGLVISEVRDFSIQDGSFEADFFLSLTGDKALPELDLIYPNGHEVVSTLLVDSPTFKLYRCTGKFTSAIDLRKYPFDTQVLKIELEDAKAGVDQLVFDADPNHTSLSESFRVASFGVASVGAHAFKHRYPARFDRDDLYVSRYAFTLGLDRFATSAAFSVFVPAFIIVLISLMGLWVPPNELEVRSAAGAPMLAAAVLFHYSLIQALPATGYLTRADKLMLGVYVSLLLNMASTWLFMMVDDDNVETVFKTARTWVPIATVAVMGAACVV